MLIFLIYQRQQVFFTAMGKRFVMFNKIFFLAGNPKRNYCVRLTSGEHNLSLAQVQRFKKTQKWTSLLGQRRIGRGSSALLTTAALSQILHQSGSLFQFCSRDFVLEPITTTKFVKKKISFRFLDYLKQISRFFIFVRYIFFTLSAIKNNV